MSRRLRQLDYACLKGERVWWPSLQGEKFEGTIKEWKDNNTIAVLQLDDGTIREIEC